MDIGIHFGKVWRFVFEVSLGYTYILILTFAILLFFLKATSLFFEVSGMVSL